MLSKSGKNHTVTFSVVQKFAFSKNKIQYFQ